MMINRIRLYNIYGLNEDYLHVPGPCVCPVALWKLRTTFDGKWNVGRL